MLFLIGLSYVGLWTIPPRSDTVYASVLDKHALLISQPAPRLIFIGGSGIALGLDSALIEQQLGLPVINMGVNAGFGLHYMLNEVRPTIQAGDIVIIVPEYEHFYGTLFEGDQNLLWALRFRPEALRQASWRQLMLLVPNIPSFMQARLQEITHRVPDPIYNRRAFNAHGDFINHLKLPPHPLELYAIQGNQALNQTAITELAEFAVYTKAQGATALLLYPTIAENFWAYRGNQTAINQLHLAISQTHVIQELDTPSDSILPAQFFFDTVYHLSEQGRRIRSERFAKKLKAIFHYDKSITHRV